MAAKLESDGALPLARRRLDHAVHALADPQPEWVGGVCRWSDSVYVRLRQAMQAQRGGYTRLHRSKLPCRVDVLTLLIEVDAAVAAWTPDEKGDTVVRLHALTGRGWRPQDVATIERHCDELARWTMAATELLTPEARVFLPMPCPRCNARVAYRQNGSGESVRVRALRVSENGCRCQACQAFWEPSEFHWLARLLGCDPLPA